MHNFSATKSFVIKNLTQCSQKKVLVIGDVMLDEYHWCHVERISPEAPVPVCKVEKTTLVPGGAANVAHNIQTLGGQAILLGVIGDDSSGEKLVHILKKAHVETGYLFKTQERPTILKSRIIAHHQHVVRVDREQSSPLSRSLQARLLLAIEKLAPTVDAILLSDYLKGMFPAGFTQKIISIAQAAQKVVVVDPKGDDYRKYRGASVLTPNFGEFKAAIRKTPKSEAEVKKEGLKLLKKLQLESLVVTRSEKGMSIISKDGHKLDIPTEAQEVFDITGAGDTVIATLATALAAKWPIEHASYLANYAAGIVVGKMGTSTTTLAEIEKELRRA